MPAYSPKKRRNGVKTRRMNLTLAVHSFEKLKMMAGPTAWNITVEELLEREWKRRKEKMGYAHISDSALLSAGTVSSYPCRPPAPPPPERGLARDMGGCI